MKARYRWLSKTKPFGQRRRLWPNCLILINLALAAMYPTFLKKENYGK
jgi:hypothetical protein